MSEEIVHYLFLKPNKTLTRAVEMSYFENIFFGNFTFSGLPKCQKGKDAIIWDYTGTDEYTVKSECAWPLKRVKNEMFENYGCMWKILCGKHYKGPSQLVECPICSE